MSTLIAVLYVFIGCDTSMPDLNVAKGVQSVEISDSNVDKSVTEDITKKELRGGDDPDPNIEVRWLTEDAENKPVDTAAIFLIVKNHLSLPAEISVEIVFGGLFDQRVSLNLGVRTLDAKEEAYLEISSDEIPIQTTKGVCAACAFVTAVYDQNGITWTASASSDNIYYRHNSDYKKLKFFKEKVFVKQYGGKLMDMDDFVSNKGSVNDYKGVTTGRVKKDSKQSEFTEVKFNIDAADKAVLKGAGIGEMSIAEMDRIFKELNNEN